MSYTVRIDKQSCLSSGRCVGAAPAAFAWDADHLGDVLPAAGELERETLCEIARACPALAISVLDAEQREIAP